MADIEKVTKGLCEAIGIIHGYVGKRYWGYGEQACRDAIELLKEQQAEIERLKDEKENAIKEIEERKAFNLKCDGQPEWLRKGIDVGLNTALDILKGKDGEQE